MSRSVLPRTDRSTVWLANLIEATETLTSSAQPCDPSIVRAFSRRLEMPADVRPLFEPSAQRKSPFNGDAVARADKCSRTRNDFPISSVALERSAAASQIISGVDQWQ
jgi:hypothetical protein